MSGNNGQSGARDQLVEIEPNGPVEPTGDPTDAGTGSGTTGGAEFIDPATATGTGADGSSDSGQPRRGRGRPKGARNKSDGGGKTSPFQAIGADGVAAILVSVHHALVMVSKCPELMISDQEAIALSKASIAVAKLYDVKASEKALAWSNLAAVAGSIYVTRAFAISMRLKMDAQTRAQANGAFGAAPVHQSPTMN